MVQLDMKHVTKEREDVWFELSSLFLDTEPSEADLLMIAERVAESSFSLEELISIMEDEVAPILHGNLLLVAGQWGCFNRQSDVVEPIKRRLQLIPDVRKNGWFPFAYLRRRVHMMVVKDDWQKVLAHIRRFKDSTASGAQNA
ncbi:MAG: hypothetical protein P4L53_28555 [Candidatus Obscuribacterales bacterium]|nr:hypothetical protein [Candidatus Obscuribacterales bacterium]